MAEQDVGPTKGPAETKTKTSYSSQSHDDFSVQPTIGMDLKTHSQEQQDLASTSVKLPNGYARGGSQPAVPGPDQSNSFTQLPPELQHITAGFHGVAQLSNRLSQECYNSLDNLLVQLSGFPSDHQPNGISPSVNDARASSRDAQMRMEWLTWAHAQRQRFMQLQTIFNWSQRAPDVSRLIDIVSWARKQEESFNLVELTFGNVKRGASVARDPCPDLDAAFEVLRRDRDIRLPDLGYVSATRLQSTEILEIVRDLNMVLHVRLNLDENLPPYLQNYTIANGKVTFYVENEFELDLALADENPSSQFWFQDLRLLCLSTADIPSGHASASIQQRVDAALATHGLAGCFEVLHEFVLTLKITTMRQQVLSLSRSQWAGCLRVEQLNRSLVLQYWAKRNGKRSWIQIGVRREQPGSHVEWDGYWPSSLSIKWVKEGKEVTDFELPAGTMQLSAEQILNSVMAQHISDLLSSTIDILERSNSDLTSLYASPLLAKSSTEPLQCSLRFPGRSGAFRSMLMEPINGRYVLRPATGTSTDFEKELNSVSELSTRFATTLHRWCVSEIRHEVIDQAGMFGWTSDHVAQGTGSVISRLVGGRDTEAVILRKPHWTDSSWRVVVMVHAILPPSYWVAKIARSKGRFETSQKAQLDLFQLASTQGWKDEWIFQPLERIAIMKINELTFGHRLTQRRIPWSFECGSWGSNEFPYIMFKGDRLLANPETNAPHAFIMASPWMWLLTTSQSGRGDNNGKIICVAGGKFHSSINNQRDKLTLHDRGFIVKPNGYFATRISSSLGAITPLDVLGNRIRKLERQSTLLSVVERCNMRSVALDNGGISVDYGSDGASATIECNEIGHLELKSLMPRTNPQSRTIKMFNTALAAMKLSIGGNMSALLRLLTLGLPMLRALEGLEALDPQASQILTIVRDLNHFRVYFLMIDVTASIDFVAHRGDASWCINIQPTHQDRPRPPSTSKFVNLYRELCQQNGKGWRGLRSGLVVVPSALEETMQRLGAAAYSATRSESSINQPGVNDAVGRPKSQHLQLQQPQAAPSAHQQQPSQKQATRGGNKQNPVVLE